MILGAPGHVKSASQAFEITGEAGAAKPGKPSKRSTRSAFARDDAKVLTAERSICR
jgi:hypothetical protein